MKSAFALLPLSLFVLTACDFPEPSETMIASQSNTSPSYRQGFDDGCHSGRQAAGSLFDQFRKDQQRFSRDPDYAQGWSDAFRQCESQEEALNRQMRSAAAINAINSSRQNRFDRILEGIDYSGLEGFGQ